MPLESDGFPKGPWTPELLAEAVSQIDSNKVGVDLRTVQLWFQDNEKGISPANIEWLARVFGCGDHEATGDWRMELREAQSRFNARRRASRKARGVSRAGAGTPAAAGTETVDTVASRACKEGVGYRYKAG